jgi:hypothetical protein
MLLAACSSTDLQSAEDLRPADIVISTEGAETASLAGSTVSGTISVWVRAPRKTARVEFFLDDANEPFEVDDRSPYRVQIDTTKLSNGEHSLTIRVFAQSRRRTPYSEYSSSFTVKNDVPGEEPGEPNPPTDPSEPTDPTEPTPPSEPTDPTEPTPPTEPTEPPAPPTDPSDPPAPPKPPADGTELRGDEGFDLQDMPADARVWYERFLRGVDASNLYPDVMAYAKTGNLYAIGRFLNVQATLMMTAFRYTGDLRLLDEIDQFMQVARAQLKDYNNDGYLNWRWLQDPNNTTWYGDDRHVLDESMTHALIAAVAWLYQNNRDLRSPSGVNYGERADFWIDYLKNDFEAKWRKRNKVSASNMDFLPYYMLHTYVEFTRYYWYMYRLTGNSAYLSEANKRADVIHDNLKTVSTQQGDAYVYPWGVVTLGNAEDGLMAVVYGQYVTQSIHDMYLDGFSEFTRTDMVRLANGVSAFVVNNGTTTYAQTVGGNQSRGGMNIEYTEGEKAGSYWAIWPYAAAVVEFDASGEIASNAEAQNHLQEGNVDSPRRVFLSGAMFVAKATANR